MRHILHIIHMQIHLHLHIHIPIIYIYTYIHIYIYTYIHIYMYMHVLIQILQYTWSHTFPQDVVRPAASNRSLLSTGQRAVCRGTRLHGGSEWLATTQPTCGSGKSSRYRRMFWFFLPGKYVFKICVCIYIYILYLYINTYILTCDIPVNVCGNTERVPLAKVWSQTNVHQEHQGACTCMHA